GASSSESPAAVAMAPGAVFRLCTLLTILALPAHACIPRSIRARVPVKIDPGYVISQVPLDRCGDVGLHFSSSDPHFMVNSDGTIVVAVVSMVTKTRSFGVWVNTGRGRSRRVTVQLIPDPEALQHYTVHAPDAPWNLVHKRFKRRWSPLPFHIIENDLPPFPKDIEMVRGINLAPKGLFSVVRDTGMLRVHGAIDREQYPKIVFEARVTNRLTGKETDRPLNLTVLVMDVNDNPPTFSGRLEFHVKEQSSPGTKVGVVNATDRDQEDTLHTMIKFRLLT
ncbi:hypothetical protein CRUP_026149, partial [Coryphaenoides rupestris]